MNNLFFTKEDPFVYNSKAEEKVDFRYCTFEKGMVFRERTTKQNCLLFLIKGEVVVDCNQFFKKTFVAGECFLLPKSSRVVLEVTQSAKILLMTFDLFRNTYDKQILNLFQVLKDKLPYRFSSLPACPLLNAFIDLLVVYLEKGMANEFLFRIKKKELFVLLAASYTKEEMVEFFHPLIGVSDFKDFVFENYRAVGNVAELVDLSGMGRTAFDARFREEFGVSARQWMLKQMAQHVRSMAMEPEVTIKDLMREFKFNSPTHFNWFCRQQYGCTPGELLKKTTKELREMKI